MFSHEKPPAFVVNYVVVSLADVCVYVKAYSLKTVSSGEHGMKIELR